MAKKIIERCYSAVSATTALQQQTAKKPVPISGAIKTKTSGYRKSNVSCTIRVPNELVGKVRALVTAYRRELQSHPDMWN
jgi:hypothetical protein